MNLIVLGPQGSGKGTQAEKLADKFHLEHIDMGKSLREVAKQDTPLGKEIYHIQNVTNTLVPSRILREVLHLKLQSIPREQGVLMEGAPRTMSQREYVEEALLESGRKIDAVIFINIPEEETMKRISKRWICKKNQHVLIMGKDIKSEQEKCPIDGSEIFQRIDDTPAGIKKRLEVNQKETLPVVENFRERGLLIEVDGTPSIEKVQKGILAELEKRSIE